MMLSSADAGPVGRRRSCSQFCRVFTLTPIKSANSDCERLVRSRIALTPEEPIKTRRDGFCSPRRTAPASRTLPSNSSKICFFTAELLFDNLGELRNLFRSQIRRHVLRIRIEQQDQVSSYRPIVDDARAATLPSRSNSDADLAYPTTTSDERAEFRMRGNAGLKATYSSSLNRLVICLVKVEVSISSTRFEYPPLADGSQAWRAAGGAGVAGRPAQRTDVQRRTGLCGSAAGRR